MTITIFGASGKMQHLLVQQALDKGYHVVGYVRNPQKMRIRHERLRLIQGTLDDTEAIEKAVRGSHAVLETVGAVSQGTRNIIAAMQKAGVKRLLLVSTANQPDAQDRPPFKFKILLGLTRALLRAVGLFNRQTFHAVRELRAAAAAVKASGLDWTLVRVFVLNNKPGAPIHAGYMGDPHIGTAVTRTDMARFLLEQVTDNRWLRQAPMLSNRVGSGK